MGGKRRNDDVRLDKETVNNKKEKKERESQEGRDIHPHIQGRPFRDKATCRASQRRRLQSLCRDTIRD